MDSAAQKSQLAIDDAQVALHAYAIVDLLVKFASSIVLCLQLASYGVERDDVGPIIVRDACGCVNSPVFSDHATSDRPRRYELSKHRNKSVLRCDAIAPKCATSESFKGIDPAIARTDEQSIVMDGWWIVDRARRVTLPNGFALAVECLNNSSAIRDENQTSGTDRSRRKIRSRDFSRPL